MDREKIKTYWNNHIRENYIESGTRYTAGPFAEFGNEVEVSRILKSLRLTRETEVLELGCGSGRMTIPLSSYVGKVVAVDFAKKQLQQLSRELEKGSINNVELVLADALTFDTSDKFDIIYLSWMAQYLPDDALFELLTRAISLLKPQGRVVSMDTLSLKKSTEINSEDYFSRYRSQQDLQTVFSRVDLVCCKKLVPYFNLYDQLFIRFKIKNVPEWVYRLMLYLEPLLLRFYQPLIYLHRFWAGNKGKPTLYPLVTIWR